MGGYSPEKFDDRPGRYVCRWGISDGLGRMAHDHAGNIVCFRRKKDAQAFIDGETFGPVNVMRTTIHNVEFKEV